MFILVKAALLVWGAQLPELWAALLAVAVSTAVVPPATPTFADRHGQWEVIEGGKSCAARYFILNGCRFSPAAEKEEE